MRAAFAGSSVNDPRPPAWLVQLPPCAGGSHALDQPALLRCEHDDRPARQLRGGHSRRRVGAHAAPVAPAVGRHVEATPGRRVDDAGAGRVARERQQRPAGHDRRQPAARRLPGVAAVQRAVDLARAGADACGVVQRRAPSRDQLLRPRGRVVERRRQPGARHRPGRTAVEAPAHDPVGDRVDGARRVRIDHDRLDRRRKLPMEDAHRRLPGGRVPGRAAVGRGVEGTAQTTRAARDHGCVGDRRPVRSERDRRHARGTRQAAGLDPGEPVIVAREEPRAGPRAVDADEHAAAFGRHRQCAYGARRRDVGRRLGDRQRRRAGEHGDERDALHGRVREP